MNLLPILEGPDREEIERRLWESADCGPVDQCWPVRGGTGHHYGILPYNGRMLRSHRVSFVLANGWAPPVVMHTCDNPPCINPAHLRGGTAADNTADCIAKGRRPKRQKLAPGETSVAEAARRLGCDAGHLRRVIEVYRETLRVPYRVGGQTIDLVCIEGPFGHLKVSAASLNRILEAQ